MVRRNQLIKLIHVAKRELGLDDETYRLSLESEIGKTSCSKMTIHELESTLSMLQAKGFRLKPRKTFKGRLSAKSGSCATTINKITAIWITMAKQGFIHDGSASALDAYVRRMTHRNEGNGVDHVAWCTPNQAQVVLESLKNWHSRVMLDAMKKMEVPYPQHSPKTYNTICETYSDVMEVS
ncbi:TPA: gp16 family protein [Vibrio harveyi]